MWNCHKIQTQHKIWYQMMYKITVFGKNEILTFFSQGSKWVNLGLVQKKKLPKRTARQHITLSLQRPYQLIEMI